MRQKLLILSLTVLGMLLLIGGAIAFPRAAVEAAPNAKTIWAATPYTPTSIITVTSGLDIDTSPSYTCFRDLSGPPAPAPDGICTLRRAIVEASAMASVDRSILIKFNIPTSDDSYDGTLDVWKIMLLNDLPYIEGGDVVIDGHTQGEIGGRANGPKIIINGGHIRLGETQYDDGNMAIGLALQEGGIHLVSDGNFVEENWVGLTDDGDGIYYINNDPTHFNYANIGGSGDDNLVKNNVVASSKGESITIDGDNNTIIGNYVGTKADGTVDDVHFTRRCHADAIYYNWFTGDGINVSGDNNRIGGPTAAERNVIVGMLFASQDPDTTPPYAMEVTGNNNVVQNNYIGKDANGDEKWACGMGIYISGESNAFTDNAIINTGGAAMGLYGSTYTIDAITLRGNVAKGVPAALEFGPSPPFPMGWQAFKAARITGISGTSVSGTAGVDSPCAGCIVEVFLEDGDDAVETLQSLGATTADGSGNWTLDIGMTLNASQGLRTTTTSVSSNQIGDRDAGTTSKLSADLYPSGVTPPTVEPTPAPTQPPPVPTPEMPEIPTLPASYATVITVTTTADPDDDIPSDTCYGTYPAGFSPPGDGLCTLRRAIQEAGVLEVARPVLISFNIPGADPGYLAAVDAWKIRLADDLPYAKRGQIIIDGRTQPGGRADDPKIIVHGGNIRLGEIAGEDHNAAIGIAAQAGEIAAVTDWNIIENCWSGLSDDGMSIHYIDDDPTKSNYASIRAGGSNNLLLNNAAASARIVSLNIAGDNNNVTGNHVGTRADGTVPDVIFHRQCKADAFYYNWFTGDGVHVSGSNNWVEANIVAGMLFASPDPEITPPDAIEVTGRSNVLQQNLVGIDADGNHVGACGAGIHVSNAFNYLAENQIANTGLYAIGIFGSGISLDAITLRGNKLTDVPSAIEFGPLVPPEWVNFIPAHITGISGTTVNGTAGAGSPCSYCTIELFLEDGDGQVEALNDIGTVTADADGNWTATLYATLAPTEGLRTTTTSADYGQIPEFEAGTTSDFSQLYPDSVTPPPVIPDPALPGPELVPPITYLPEPTLPVTYATTLIVTTTADIDTSPSYTCVGDYSGPPEPAPDGICTLRRAIVEASADDVARPVLITFNIPTGDDGYNAALDAWKMVMLDDLPYISGGYVVIDGESQPGGRTGAPKIIINGASIHLGEIAGDDHNAAIGLATQEGEIAAVHDHNIIENCWAGLTDDGTSIYYINGDPDRASYASIRAGGDNNLIRNNASSSAQEVNYNIAGDYNLVYNNYSGTSAEGTVPDIAANRKCRADAMYYNWFTGDGMHIGGAYNQVHNNTIAGMLFASLDPETTPPDAVEITGHHNLFYENSIGVDSDGKEVGVCGMGIYVSNGYNQISDNEIVGTGLQAITIFGTGISLDSTALRGNTLKDVAQAVDFGPLVPVTRTLFNAAEIDAISGVNVSGSSGPDWNAGIDGPTGPSACPFCRVELFIDDGDDQVEALEPAAVTQADADGNWSATLGATLAPTQGLRTASTTRDYGVIATFEISTTTRFSPLYGDPTPPDPTPEPTPLPPEEEPDVDYLPIPEPPVSYGNILTVTTAADPDTRPDYTCYGTYTGGASPPGDGLCTLRRAIIEASKMENRPILIRFDIPTGDAGYDGALDAWIIDTAGALPNVKGSQVTIDGDTQAGGRANAPKIVVVGSDIKLGQIAGEDDNIVNGLALQMGGIWMYTDRNIVTHNWIGLTGDGTGIYYDQDMPTRSNDATIAGTGSNNLIQDNVIATSIMVGIDLEGDDNVIYGNYVGTRADGTLPDIPVGDRCVPGAATNWWTGAGIDVTGNRNRIGGALAGQPNIIAGMLSPSTTSTPPAAVNIGGRYNRFENNRIGQDATGQDVWICGQAVDMSGLHNRILSNTIASTVNNGWYVFGVWGDETSMDGLTFRGNTFHGFEESVEYGPTVPGALRLFNPAMITMIDNVNVTGMADDACPYCVIDLYLDDDNEATDALEYLGSTTASISGDWSFTLPDALGENEGLRTQSTTRNFDVIHNFELGTSSKFSILFQPQAPQAPVSVALTPPDVTSYQINQSYNFIADVSPVTATLPVTYTWEATGHAPQTVRGGTSNDIDFTWSTAGSKAITVTAINSVGGPVSAHYALTIEAPQAPASVSITPPGSGYAIDQSYSFVANVSPLSTTTPITYTWEATDQTSQSSTGGTSDTIQYTWSITGAKTITVTATNGYGSPVSAYYDLTVQAEVNTTTIIYLPLVMRQ